MGSRYLLGDYVYVFYGQHDNDHGCQCISCAKYRASNDRIGVLAMAKKALIAAYLGSNRNCVGRDREYAYLECTGADWKALDWIFDCAGHPACSGL